MPDEGIPSRDAETQVPPEPLPAAAVEPPPQYIAPSDAVPSPPRPPAWSDTDPDPPPAWHGAPIATARPPAPPPDGGAALPAEPVPANGPPRWVWPSVALGLVYPALASSARRDVDLVGRLAQRMAPTSRVPLGVVPVVVAVAVTAPFSLFRFGIVESYTESLPFLVLALAVGMLSPAAGVLVVLFHALFDVVAAGAAGSLDPFFPALLGRLVSHWLLWLLVVAIPLMARAVPVAAMASGQPSDPLLRRVVALASGMLAAGALLFIWTQAVPLLIRPLFVWQVQWSSGPLVEAVAPVQVSGMIVVALGVVLVAAVTLLRMALRVIDDEVVQLRDPGDMEMDAMDEAPSAELEFVGRIVTHILSVVALGGLITGAVDIAILVGVLLVARPLAGVIVRGLPLARLLARVPWVIRFVTGFLLTYVVGLIVTGLTYQPQEFSEFFPLILTVAAGLLIFEILFSADAQATLAGRRDAPDTGTATAAGPAGSMTATVLGVTLLWVAAWLLLPGAAMAHNCSGLYDCNGSASAGAATAAGAAAVAGIGAVAAATQLGRNREARERRRRRRGPGMRPSDGPPSSPDGAPPPPAPPVPPPASGVATALPDASVSEPPSPSPPPSAPTLGETPSPPPPPAPATTSATAFSTAPATADPMGAAGPSGAVAAAGLMRAGPAATPPSRLGGDASLGGGEVRASDPEHANRPSAASAGGVGHAGVPPSDARGIGDAAAPTDQGRGIGDAAAPASDAAPTNQPSAPGADARGIGDAAAPMDQSRGIGDAAAPTGQFVNEAAPPRNVPAPPSLDQAAAPPPLNTPAPPPPVNQPAPPGTPVAISAAEPPDVPALDPTAAPAAAHAVSVDGSPPIFDRSGWPQSATADAGPPAPEGRAGRRRLVDRVVRRALRNYYGRS